MQNFTHKNVFASNSQTLVTCHSNADFDAFASIIAAQILYPDAILLFPGSHEKSLMSVYNEVAKLKYNFKNPDEINWDTITKLIIVDTRQNSRVPHVKQLLTKEDIEIHIWDHHPNSRDDIKATYTNIEPLGSTTTLMLQSIRSQNLEVSSQDATLLGLGIYGDTGSFTYASTTSQDYFAAAWLLEKGMDVTAIADLAAHELTSAHVQALNALLESAISYTVGSETVVVADASMEHYLGDFAHLAHKLMEMEKFSVLFAIGRMGDCISVVARSRNNSINVGDVCEALGGGGHSYAASASVRNMTMQQIHDVIFQGLYRQAQSSKYARDYMTHPVIGMEEDKTMHDAYILMQHFGIKAIPIYKKGTHKCIGILEAQTASRAVQHNLNEFDTYMQREILTVSPDACLMDIIDIIIGTQQILVPVVENDEVIGVISRTDLVHIFAEKPEDFPVSLRQGRKERCIINLMRERLASDTYELLEKIGKLSQKLSMTSYAVGGFVRDLLLNRPNYDIDIVVEVDGITFARELAKLLKGRVREHQKFFTAVVIFQDKNNQTRQIDVATARLEYYEYPAAVPTVELSSLKLDLIRRDFTINSLAIRLNDKVFGQLVDFFGGQRDINDRRIRVLHTLSFVEDPSRILRAVRFEQRYEFKLGSGLEKLIKNAINLDLIEELSGARLFHEMRQIFEEPDPVAIFKRLNGLGILSSIHAQLLLNPQKLEILQFTKEILDWYRLLYFEKTPQSWIVYVLALCYKQNYKNCSSIISRLGLPQAQQHEFLSMRERARNAIARIKSWHANKHRKISDLYTILEPIPIEMLLFIMARTASENLRKALSRYITTWQYETIELNGNDLLELGLKPGPIYAFILKAIKTAKLDGIAPTRDSQYIIAQKMAHEYMNNDKT